VELALECLIEGSHCVEESQPVGEYQLAESSLTSLGIGISGRLSIAAATCGLGAGSNAKRMIESLYNTALKNGLTHGRAVQYRVRTEI
jgi:hypothetical protein